MYYKIYCKMLLYCNKSLTLFNYYNHYWLLFNSTKNIIYQNSQCYGIDIYTYINLYILYMFLDIHQSNTPTKSLRKGSGRTSSINMRLRTCEMLVRKYVLPTRSLHNYSQHDSICFKHLIIKIAIRVRKLMENFIIPKLGWIAYISHKGIIRR